MTDEELCDCGQPLHYRNPSSGKVVRNLIQRLGRTVDVTVLGYGTYKVPRHYIALHGITGNEVPVLARQFGWERITNQGDGILNDTDTDTNRA